MNGEGQQSLEELRREKDRLQRAVRELSVLNEVTATIAGTMKSDRIMQVIVQKSIAALNAEQGDITLVENNGPTSAGTLVRTMVTSAGRDALHLNQSLLGWMYLYMKPLTLNDPRVDERFKNVEWDASLRSLVCVPLEVKSKLIGILTLYNKKGGDGFSEDDQRMLAVIAGQSAQVMENARLYEKERTLTRIKEELRLAKEIHDKLLPNHPPVIPGYEICARSEPAKKVGGDYFDFLHREDGCLVVCVGDITGKGIPAALLMANLQATIRSTVYTSSSCHDCIVSANRLLFHSTESDQFATLFIAALQPETGLLRFCNAGHNFPMLFRNDGTVELLETGGLMLGAFETSQFDQGELQMQPGELLLVYSDGVSEALNSSEEEFGEERLKEIVRNHNGGSVDDLVESIFHRVHEFCNECDQSDDITILALKRRGRIGIA